MMGRKDLNAQAKTPAAIRRRSALEYRKAGMPYRAIGERLDVSHQQAFKDVQSALKEVRDSTKESAEELVELEQQRLDTAVMALASRVAKGDGSAIDRWVRISESRRKLLGLDAPAKSALTNPDGTKSWQPFNRARVERLKRLPPEMLKQFEELMALLESDDGDDDEDDD